MNKSMFTLVLLLSLASNLSAGQHGWDEIKTESRHTKDQYGFATVIGFLGGAVFKLSQNPKAAWN